MILLTTDEFEMLSSFIEDVCGIALQADKQYLVESRLSNLLAENGCENFGEFYNKAKDRANVELRDKIVDAMTTNETLWFRDESPFIALREKIFPEYFEQKKPIKIWSAACSTGQEPYSIVMTAHETLRSMPSVNLPVDMLLSILATDISSSALMLAKNARYNAIAMSRGLAPEFKDRYFDVDGQICKVKEEIKKPITFQKFNLQMPFEPMGEVDIVFLRNVAIYFSAEFKKELFAKIAKMLKPGGYLFIGASETLMGYSEDFALLEHNKSRYYQVKK